MDTSLPVWLKNLESLLSCGQMDFLIRCFKMIMKQVQFSGRASTDRVNEIKRMADGMKVDFESLVEKLKKSTSGKTRFLEKYPEWRGVRDLNVKHLRKIADSIDKNRKEALDSKVGMNLFSLAAGGVCLLAGGGILRLLGGAVMGLTAVAALAEEENSLHENIKTAQKVVELDRDNFKKLIDYLDDACSMRKEVMKFDSIDYGEEFSQKSEKLKEISNNKHLSIKEMEGKILMILKSFRFPPDVREAVRDIMVILTGIHMLIGRFGHLFQLELDDAEAGCNAVGFIRNAFASVNSFAVGCGLMKSCQKWMLPTLMISDVLNIILVAAQDPKSAEGKQIREAASDLENEANKIKKLYEELKQLQRCDFKQLREAISDFENEANEFKKLYEELKQLQRRNFKQPREAVSDLENEANKFKKLYEALKQREKCDFKQLREDVSDFENELKKLCEEEQLQIFDFKQLREGVSDLKNEANKIKKLYEELKQLKRCNFKYK